MPVIIGKVVTLTGHFFARDENGVVRELHEGDEVYATDTLFSNDGPTAEMTIALTDGGALQCIGGTEYALAETADLIAVQNDLPPSDQQQDYEQENDAVGYEGVFSERSGEIIDVKTTLRASQFFHIDPTEERINGENQDNSGAKPAPVLTVSGGEVQDNYYDSVGASGNNSTTNVITFETLAGCKTVQIGDHSFDQNALLSINTTPVIIDMVAGQLILDGYTQAGNLHTISYNYATTDDFHHNPGSDVFVDSLSIIVTAVDGQTDSSPLNINVIDDLPTSEGDTNIIQEGLIADNISGNVFLGADHGSYNHGGSLGNVHYADTADHLGADETTINAPVVGVASGSDTSHSVTGNIATNVTGLYGNILINADGSYNYHLDNTNQDVKAIVDGEVLHDVFTYTISDDDTDTVTTTLDITIAGNSADPVITVQPVTVDETALAMGTDPNNPNEIVTGKIIGTANNGFDQLDLQATNGNILSITILANINGSQTLTTPQGTLTLISYTETAHPLNPAVRVGTIDYSYELTSAHDNQIASSSSFDDLISLTIIDSAAHTTTENLVITITDDEPVATDDIHIVIEDAADVNIVTGNVLSNDNDGADTNITPITPQNINGAYGHFNLNADGSYTYTLDNNNPAVNGLNTGESLTDPLIYTLTDGDGDETTATLMITINGVTDPGLRVLDQSISEDGGNIIFTVQIDTISNRDITFNYGTVDGTALDGVEYTGVSGTATIIAGTLMTTISVPLGADDYIADDGKNFELQISNVNSGAMIADNLGTATITDDSNPNTPYIDNDSAVQENTLDAITLKLIAVDSAGNPLNFPDVNGVNEGESAYYKVIVVDPNNGDAPVLDSNGNLASGSVNINIINGTAIGGVSGPPSTGDFDATQTNVQVNTVFSIDAFTDGIADKGEIFEVQIAADSSYSSATEYEQVNHDLTPVTTVIDDSHTLADFVFAHLLSDATVDEADGALLTHRIELMKLDGTPVNLPTGKQVTINLEYLLDTTEAADFQTKTVQVVITGNGGSTYTFSNTIADDFLAEGSESYTLRISSVDNTSSYFSDFYFGAGRVTGTINDEPVADVALVSLTGAQLITEGDLSTDYTLQLDQPAADVTSDITVNLSYSGVAQDGTDYAGVAQVVIAAGSDETHFNLATLNDALIEGDESFTMTIDSIVDTNFEAIQATPGSDSVVTIIRDNVEAQPDTADVIEGGNIVNLPNLLDNDEIGLNGEVTGFTYHDENGQIVTGAPATSVNTQYGQITINADGSWTYTSDPHEEHPADGNTESAVLTDVITYTVTDVNNKTSQSTLSINVRDTIATIDAPVAQSLDEDDLSTGSDTTGALLINDADLGINLNHDPIADVVFNQVDVDTALTGLTSGGTALTYVLSSADHVLTASVGSNEIFVVTLNQNGENSTYDFELKGALDHAVSGEDSLGITIPFNVREQGANEDVVRGNMQINIIDDVPTTINDVQQDIVEGSGATLGGNVLTGSGAGVTPDTQGADSAELKEFTYRDNTGTNQTFTFTDGSDKTVATETGQLTVNRDGTWSFDPVTTFDHDNNLDAVDSLIGVDDADNDATNGSFTYTLVDGDGDTSIGQQFINVTDGASPHSGDVVNAVDEDDLAGGSSPDIPATSVTGNFSVSAGADPIEKVEFTDNGTGTLHSNGVAIDYILSNNGLTLTGGANGVTIFVATVTGTPTNPTYSFELQGSIDHPLNPSGNDAEENIIPVVLEYKATDWDGDATTSHLTVIVTDDVPSIGAGQLDGLVDEAALPGGSGTGGSIIANGTLDVNPDADHFDTQFTNDTIAGLPALVSNGLAINYTIGPDGHTLLATRSDGQQVFIVHIFNADQDNATYQFKLEAPIDHSAGSGTNLEALTFSFQTGDVDGDNTTENFVVSIKDDVALGTKAIELDEDGSKAFAVSADEVIPASITYTGVEHGVVTFDLGTNNFTYTPHGDYSGLETFRIQATDIDGDPIDMVISATVHPIADVPSMQPDITLTTQEDNNNAQEGLNVVALGLHLPTRNDQTDQSTADSSNPVATVHDEAIDDSLERLGLITFDFSPSGDIINGTRVFVDANHNGVLDGGEKELLTVTSGNKDFTVTITDVADYHPTDIGNADFDLTQAEYESISVIQVEDNANNISMTIAAASHEVQDNGSLWPTDIVSSSSTQTVDIDVQAVTDPVTITLTDTDGAGTGVVISDSSGDGIDDTIHVTFDEDTNYDFSGIISEHFGDLDGSETYQYELTGLPVGTEVTADGTTITADGTNPAVVPFTGQAPTFNIKPPANFSGDINGITIRLIATDRELHGETDNAPLITDESATVTLNMHVESVSDDVTVTDISTLEDTAVKFIQNLTFTDTDGSESVTGIELLAAKNSDLADWTLRDHQGNAIPTDVNGDYKISDSQVNLLNYTLTPPPHSSLDINMVIGIEISDDDGTHTNKTIFDHGISITVTPVTETDQTDTAAPGGNDVALNGDHTYGTHMNEDAWFKLDRSASGETDLFKLNVTNEDDANSSNSHGSETTNVLFTHVTDGASTLLNAQLQYTDSGNKTHILSLNADVEVPLEFLDSVQIKGPDNYSGAIEFDMQVQTIDHDEDDPNVLSNVETSTLSTLTFQIDPVVDGITQTVGNSKGDEDAGRNTDGTVNAASAANGIVINATAKSHDTDGSEHLNVYFDKIPDNAAIYYDINHDGTKDIITKNTSLPVIVNGPGGLVNMPAIVDNGNGTWKLLIENFSDTGIAARDKPLIIPPHNSNVDITLDIQGYAVDTYGTVTVTSPLGILYHTNVVITGVADDVVNNEIYAQDIVVTVDPATLDLTVTRDDTNIGKYSAVVEEDMSNTQAGATFNLRNIYENLQDADTTNDPDSYDNLYSNDSGQNKIADTSVASEQVSVKITNLDAQFDIHGATLVSGTGTNRVWVVSGSDIDAGHVTITTAEHFSGEVDLTLTVVTTENDGDTKTSIDKDITLLVTPEAEGTAQLLQASTDVLEDTLTHMDFNNHLTLPDADEYVSAMGIVKSGYTDSSGHVLKGVDGADFTIYVGNSAVPAQALQTIGADTGDDRVQIVTEHGEEFYKIIDPVVYGNLYVLYDADIGGFESNPTTPHQINFGFKFDVADKTTAIPNGSSVDLIDTESGFQNTADYTFNFTPVTDDITADAQGVDITDIDGDGTNDITVSGHDVTILGPTTINVAVKINGVDSDGNGQLDSDGSEQVRHIRVEGVPDGIGIEDGKFIGNVAGQPDTGVWLVDLQNPIIMDGNTQTYNLQFLVDAIYQNFTPASGTAQAIHISIINQEYDSNGVAQATAQTGDFTLNFTKDPAFSGTSTHAPMDILDTSGATTNEDGYSIRSTFAGFIEDTPVKLKNIMNLSVNDVQGSNNNELGTTIDSNLFSITLENLNGATVNAGGSPIHSGTTTGWHIETVTDSLGVTKDIYTYRGSGNQSAILTALDALVITPDQNKNSNNIIGTNIEFTTTLTTYTQSGVKDVVTTSYSGDIKPVTDPVTVQPDQVNVDEDVTQTISFALDTVDNSFGATYATVVDSSGNPLTTVSFTYVGSSDSGHGQFGVTLGGVHFNPGDTKDVSVTLSGGTIDLDFVADLHESGTVTFTYDIYSKEVNSNNISHSTSTLSIDIAPVADGLNVLAPQAIGNEDTLIEITDGSQPITSDLIDNVGNNTTPETLQTVVVGDVPTGWLIYIGDPNSQVLAQNLGDDGSGNNTNSWNVLISGGTVPRIWVQPPAQVGDVTATFDLQTIVLDGGQNVTAHTPIAVIVNPITDSITINPSPVSGIEGQSVALALNASSADTDGSEKYAVTLKSLGEGAIFYLGATELTAAEVHYDRNTQTYTILETAGIDHSNLDTLTIVQNDGTYSVETQITVHDGSSSTSTSNAETFELSLVQENGTANNDILLYDTKGVDGLGGDDTVVFGTDWDGANTIDMSSLKNIESFDLTKHGDHGVTVTTTDVEAMTDARNALVIDTDSGDTVTLQNDGDNVWAQQGSTTVYEDINGATVTISGGGTINMNALIPSTGDDVLGYNGTNSIDGDAGIDRLIIFDVPTIDYSKIQNIETLDLSVKGNHDLGSLSLSDVVSMTDTNNDLVIKGDSGDAVDFSTAAGWVLGSSSGGYTEYTNTNDSTIEVKVSDDVNDQIIV